MRDSMRSTQTANAVDGDFEVAQTIIESVPSSLKAALDPLEGGNSILTMPLDAF